MSTHKNEWKKCVWKIVKLTLFLCYQEAHVKKKKKKISEKKILSAVRDDELLHLLYTYLSEWLIWRRERMSITHKKESLHICRYIHTYTHKKGWIEMVMMIGK